MKKKKCNCVIITKKEFNIIFKSSSSKFKMNMWKYLKNNYKEHVNLHRT